MASEDSAVCPRRTTRWRLRGTLKTRTWLHLGDGEEVEDRVPQVKRDDGEEPVRTQTVATDGRGRPYIPGSALKGVLRPVFAGLSGTDACARIFGVEPESSNDRGNGLDGGGRGGAACFLNAYLQNDKPPQDDRLNRPGYCSRRRTDVLRSVSIRRTTRTARENLLFAVEAVPPGESFEVAITFAGPSEEDARMMLKALAGFNHDPGRVFNGDANARHAPRPLALGAETANGWGRVEWKPLAVETLDPEDFLSRSAGTPAAEAYKTVPAFDPPPDPSPLRTARTPLLRLYLELGFDGPFLVNDSAWCQKQHEEAEKSRRDGDDTEEHRGPDFFPRRTYDKRLLLPAQSFRGAFRSQVERIARTLTPGAVGDPHAAPAGKHRHPLMQLFGVRDWATRLHVSDFLSQSAYADPDAVDERGRKRETGEAEPANHLREPDAADKKEKKLSHQELVAIDRITGGAAHQAKFDAVYAWAPTLKGYLEVELDRTPPWVLGLLALAMRDLVEGDVSFGLGAAKGYGACTARIVGASLVGATKTNLHSGIESILRQHEMDAEALDEQMAPATAQDPRPGERLVHVLDDLVADLRSNPGRLSPLDENVPAE